MSYTLDKLKYILTMPHGRRVFYISCSKSLWQYTQWIANMYRRTAIRNTRIISVVGSVGKTTTTRALQSVFIKGKPNQNPGNARQAIAGNILRIKPWDKYSVIETAVGGPGQMEANSRAILPNIVVVTAIKSEHNRSFKTLENTRDEKCIIIRNLSPDGVAVLNGDDENVLWMKQFCRGKVITYGFNPSNDIVAADYRLDWPQGLRFTLKVDGKTYDIRSRLLGRANVYCLLSAFAVAREEGLSPQDAIAKLTELTSTPGRLELVNLGNNIYVIDDSFKGPLESTYAALDVLEDVPATGRKIVVMGNIQEPPGSQGPIYKELGNRAARMTDKFYFLGEVFPRIKSGLVGGGMDKDNIIKLQGSMRDIGELLKGELRPGDVCLIKGRNDQAMRRLTLFLKGRDVQCRVRSCQLPMYLCDQCPFLSSPQDIFQNKYLKDFVRF